MVTSEGSLPPIRDLLNGLPPRFQSSVLNPRNLPGDGCQDDRQEGINAVPSFDRQSEPSEHRVDLAKPWAICSLELRSDIPLSAQKQSLLMSSRSTKPSPDAHRLDNGDLAYNIESACAPYQAHGIHTSTGCSPGKLPKQSNLSGNLKITRKSGGLQRSSDSVRGIEKKDAQREVHKTMEQRRRREIGDRTRDIATLIEVDGTKVEILTRAVEWIDAAKSRITELAVEVSQLRSRKHVLLEQNANAREVIGNPSMNANEWSNVSNQTNSKMILDEWSLNKSASPWVFVERESPSINTTKYLSQRNCTVYVASRNREKAIAQAETSLLEPRGAIKFHHLDLISIEAARRSAEDFLKLEDHLDIVVANAGISMLNLSELSPDGFERMFATNHLGHFVFIHMLLG
ncbi:MAG: hypothetical protein Q9181_001733 [Wetmoreana brouardii]